MQRSKVFVFDTNINSGEIIKNFVSDLDTIEQIEICNNFQEGYEKLKTTSDAIAIIDITETNEEQNNIINNIKLHTNKILITSMNPSTDTIIKALRTGAKDFLPKPVLKEDLIKAITKLTKISYDDYNNQSKIISIYSNKGGIGKTTTAVNLAAELAKITKDKVALIDLNLQLGDISTFLNLNPPFDSHYVMNRLLDKDENILIKGFEKYKDLSLYVLSDPSYIEQSESITVQQITKFLETLKKVFPYIIIDMSSNIDSISLKILDTSDIILFTTIVNLPALRNAQRCLNLFYSRKYPKNKIKIIINRFIENDEITINDIENTLGESVYWKIPNNYFTIIDSINKGCCIFEINPASNISNSFRDLATKISDEIIEQSLTEYKI